MMQICIFIAQCRSSSFFVCYEVLEGMESLELRPTWRLMIDVLCYDWSIFLIISEMPFTIVCSIPGRWTSSSRCRYAFLDCNLLLDAQFINYRKSFHVPKAWYVAGIRSQRTPILAISKVFVFKWQIKHTWDWLIFNIRIDDQLSCRGCDFNLFHCKLFNYT